MALAYLRQKVLLKLNVQRYGLKVMKTLVLLLTSLSPLGSSLTQTSASSPRYLGDRSQIL